MIKLVALLFLSYFCSAEWSKDLKIRIEDGRILGRYMTSESGKTIRAFMGIPYAEPPIGDLRFRPPMKKKIWRDVLRTQTEPPKCLSSMDPYARSAEIVGQEDCLYLNVYAPQVEKNSEKRFPVMVFIHGGGWMTGSGEYSAYPPQYFLDHDVILVTGNYRLGILGFLSFEDAACPGNFGLKDQNIILQWVKMNIDKFGGDSNKITIFGQSAGGASVDYHSIAPISRGLFEQGILQSGSLMNIWSDPPRPGLAKMRAIRLTQMMGCPISNTNYPEMTECLREVDSKNLTDAIKQFYEWDLEPMIPFPPVLEDFHQEGEPFLSSMHYNKHAFDIPWMVGMTTEEGLIECSVFFPKENEKFKNRMIREWDKMLPIKLYYDHHPEVDQKKITEKISKFYFTNGVYDDTQKQNLINLYTDALLTAGIVANLKFRLKNNNRENTFVYLHSHKGSSSFSEIYGGGEDKFYGTAHGDDLLHLFPLRKSYPQLYSSIPTEEDRNLSKAMVKLWVDFARTGKPTPEWTKNSEYPYWSPASDSPIDYMLIGNSNGKRKELFTMEKGFFEERYRFWEELQNEFPMLTEWSFHKIDNNKAQKDEF